MLGNTLLPLGLLRNQTSPCGMSWHEEEIAEVCGYMAVFLKLRLELFFNLFHPRIQMLFNVPQIPSTLFLYLWNPSVKRKDLYLKRIFLVRPLDSSGSLKNASGPFLFKILNQITNFDNNLYQAVLAKLKLFFWERKLRKSFLSLLSKMQFMWL